MIFMKKKLLPLVIAFVVLTIGMLIGQSALEAKHVDTTVLLIGNAVIFAITLLAHLMYAAALKSEKSYGFVRQVYTGFILKFFALLVLAMVYFYFAKEVNKPAVFICMVIYLLYNFLGTSQVVRKPAHPAPDAHQAHKHKKKKHH